jgi:hypothetical protein
MIRLRILVCACAVLFLAMSAWAEGTICGGNETPVIPDGRVTTSSIPASTTYFFLVQTQVGHSYSVEVRAPIGTYSSLSNSMTLYSPSDTSASCASSSVTIANTTDTDPSLANTGSRRSFTATDTFNNGWYRIKLVNGTGAGQTYSISVTDTTLHNPRWSTFSSYITQYAFRNTTSVDIHGTLTVTPTLGGGSPATLAVTVPANTEVFKVVAASGGDVNMGASKAGFATFSNDGPPGGIIADAYFINPSGTVIVFSKFEPRTQPR